MWGAIGEMHLVIAYPQAIVCNCEVNDMVNEGLAPGVASRGGKHVSHHLLDNLPVGLIIERLLMKALQVNASCQLTSQNLDS